MLLGIAVALAGILGLVVGSFLNVVIHRVPAGVSIVSPPSACPECGQRIRWTDNVPLLSWLLLRGRCRDCGAPISARYPLVEAGTAVAFVLVALLVLADWPLSPAAPVAGSTVATGLVLIGYLWFVAAGIALAAIDLDVRRLPNPIVYSTGIALLLLLAAAAAIAGTRAPLITALLGGAAVFALYVLIVIVAPRGGMGLGDVKLAAVVGIATGWAGWPAVVVGTFSAFLLGSLVGIGLIVARRAGRRSQIPFGPWMLAGAWAGIVVGGPVWQGYAAIVGLA